MAGFGLSVAEIAKVFGIDAELLRATFANELDSGQIKASARVAESLYRKALGDGREAVTAAFFWLKTRARWKEVHVSEIVQDASDPL
jgi:membrane-bound lytic murein transglycosylase B